MANHVTADAQVFAVEDEQVRFQSMVEGYGLRTRLHDIRNSEDDVCELNILANKLCLRLATDFKMREYRNTEGAPHAYRGLCGMAVTELPNYEVHKAKVISLMSELKKYR